MPAATGDYLLKLRTASGGQEEIFATTLPGGTPGTPGTPTSGDTVHVTTEATLRSAVAAGVATTVVGEIVLVDGGELVIDKPGTAIYAKADANGQRGKITRTGTAGAEQDIILITAPRVKLIGLEITANNPLAPMPAGGQYDTGIRIHPQWLVAELPSQDSSDCVIEDCYIHHVTSGIGGTASGAVYADRMRIRNNRIESFSDYGIVFQSNCRDLTIEGNWIWGKKKSEAHPGMPLGTNEIHATAGNGIYVGSYVQRAKICCNDIAYLERHGIEVVAWPAGSHEPYANDGLIIAGNNIHDLNANPGLATFAISLACGGNGCIVAHNQIRNVTGYGIECYNDGPIQGHYLIIGNHIANVIGSNQPYSPGNTVAPFAWVPVGIIVNSMHGALVTGNFVENVRPGYTVAEDKDSFGISIMGGASGGHGSGPAFLDVTVSNNKLVDAGQTGILVNGNGGENRSCSVIGNEIRLTPNRYHPPAPGGNNATWAVCVGGCNPNNPIVVKDNIHFYPTSDPPATGGYWAFNTGFNLAPGGAVFCGDSTEAPRTNSTPATAVVLGGSNLTIPYTI